jgi:hypothetical protein
VALVKVRVPNPEAPEMTTATPHATTFPDASPPLPDIPDADAIRIRLAAVQTEANVLRQQLRVSVRARKERERLQRLVATAPEGSGRE